MYRSVTRALRIVARAMIGDAAADEIVGTPEAVDGVLLAPDDLAPRGGGATRDDDAEALLTLGSM